MEIRAGDMSGRPAVRTDGGSRRNVLEKSLSLLVGEDDPWDGLQRGEAFDNFRRYRLMRLTVCLASVSGWVKNCGAHGSIAPPGMADRTASLRAGSADGSCPAPPVSSEAHHGLMTDTAACLTSALNPEEPTA